MKLTYHGQPHFENSLKLRFLFLTVTFDVKGGPVKPWIPLILFSHLFNLACWPLVVIWSLRELGAPVTYSLDSIAALFLLYTGARFLMDESKEAKT